MMIGIQTGSNRHSLQKTAYAKRNTKGNEQKHHGVKKCVKFAVISAPRCLGEGQNTHQIKGCMNVSG